MHTNPICIRFREIKPLRALLLLILILMMRIQMLMLMLVMFKRTAIWAVECCAVREEPVPVRSGSDCVREAREVGGR